MMMIPTLLIPTTRPTLMMVRGACARHPNRVVKVGIMVGVGRRQVRFPKVPNKEVNHHPASKIIIINHHHHPILLPKTTVVVEEVKANHHQQQQHHHRPAKVPPTTTMDKNTQAPPSLTNGACASDIPPYDCARSNCSCVDGR